MRCPCCDRNLAATNNSRKGSKYLTLSYRCNTYNIYKNCDFNKTIGEKKIEAALLDQFDSMVTSYIETSKIEDARIRDSHATDKIKELKGEMERTTKAYRKGRITEAEYDKVYDELDLKLKELETHLEPI